MERDERIRVSALVNAGVPITLNELQVYWQCSRSTIWRAMRRADEPLKGEHVNGRIMFPAQEIRRHHYGD